MDDLSWILPDGQDMEEALEEMDEVESIIHQMVEDSDVPVESVAYIIIGDKEGRA